MNLTQQRLAGGITSAQRVETDALMSEVHFAAHESMWPIAIDKEGSAEQIDVAFFTAAAQEDHGAFERGAEVELEAFWEAAPLGCEFSAGGGLSAIGCDITSGDARHGFDIGEVVTLPDLALPQPIEAFDGILEARLARWGEDRGHSERQTQPADTSDGVGRSVCSLEYCGVVKLGISRQPVTTPALDQGLQRGPSAGPLHDPGLGQRAVQAGAGEHIDKRACGNLQILDEIEGVQFGSPTGQIGKIPPLGRCRPALSVHTIKRAATRKHAVDRRAPRDSLNRPALMQRQADCIKSVLPQHAVLAQRSSHAQDVLFQGRRRAVPGPAGFTVCEAYTVNAFAPSMRDPVGSRTHTDPELQGYRSQALPPTYRTNQLAAALFKRRFLTMTDPSQMQERYTKPGPRETHGYLLDDSTAMCLSARPPGRRRARRKLQSPYGLPAFPPHMLFADDSVFN